MVRQLLFKSDGVVATGVLPGGYLFPEAGVLSHAVLQIRPPTAGVITLALEIDGALARTAEGERLEFTIASVPRSGPGSATQPQAEVVVRKVEGISGLVVPEGALVRWRVVAFSAPVEDGPLPVSVALAYRAGTYAVAFVRAHELTVRWVNGGERLALFDYDPDTRTFSETLESEGLSAARATLTGGADFTAVIEGVTVLQCAGGKLQCGALVALGGVATPEAPRLEFLVNDRRVATLTRGGVLRVARAVEGEPVESAAGFSFSGGGTVRAVLTEQALTLAGIEIV